MLRFQLDADGGQDTTSWLGQYLGFSPKTAELINESMSEFNKKIEVTVTLTIYLVTPKWMWRVELIKVNLHMKFQRCRWRHFDFRANVKILARRRRTADDEMAMTIPGLVSS
ncbi:hypothetical protein DPMN_076223 [Dreissena polymorpha]|uniref:Uncharacterized protein n=1 Tax=Dreissena polymorpha TaxID=45954 RepID=A0A9D3YLZ0_DREPO|nr:hypothetical protein DPMN_076223 [Dreissena polymorpha]